MAEDLKLQDPSYIYARMNAYPSIEIQLDMIYWDKKNGTDKWLEMIDKIKQDNPKSITE